MPFELKAAGGRNETGEFRNPPSERETPAAHTDQTVDCRLDFNNNKFKIIEVGSSKCST